MKKFFLNFVLLSVLILSVGSVALMAVPSAPQDKSHGIGPVKTVELGPLNAKWVAEGKGIFNTQCIVCHDLDQKKIGPVLRNITKQRAPEFIMNLLLNSAQCKRMIRLSKLCLRNTTIFQCPILHLVNQRHGRCWNTSGQ